MKSSLDTLDLYKQMTPLSKSTSHVAYHHSERNRRRGRGSGTANFLFEASGGCAAVVQPYGFKIGPGEEIRMFSALGFCNERADPPVSVGNTFTVTADYDDAIDEFTEGNNSCVVLVRHDETSWWTYDCLAH